MKTYNIDGKQIKFFGNDDSTMEVKFNRVARIAEKYNDWKQELIEYISQNKTVPTSKEYNLSVALLTIMTTGIRIGNEDSAEGFYSDYKQKGKTVFAHTYGLTTMLKQHVVIKNGIVYFDFVGKKHVENKFQLPKDLSSYVIPIVQSNYNPLFNITEGELTSFIKKFTSKNLSSKDFRTFRANVYAFEYASGLPAPTTKKERRERIKAVAEFVSSKLNNTPSVVKSSYIDPELFDYFFPEILREGGNISKCGCDMKKDGIDTDILFKLPIQVLNILSKQLGLKEGTKYDNENYKKILKSKSDGNLREFITKDPVVKKFILKYEQN